MKILIVCSTCFYDKISFIKDELEKEGYSMMMPNGYYEEISNNYDNLSDDEYVELFNKFYHDSRVKIESVDAILVLNYTKIKNNQELKNYIGASTFLEMYEAFMQNKKIYILNGYPDSMLYDEIKGFNPIILNGDLKKLK